ncbi:hypothetical protein J4N45_09965 [Vibrio sp. SCSIO 43140]|uniref:hypothetical protein n=1 Tax=Vibrio sp. SCSIO 43140 TaxID=2819100 RepID=UPI0020754AB2|nr:hypothetical protein [Vibrio sp. SCSIO 43140]USD58854.1 hypothetical protein J4N45_09965 [Vibrio sp. SCSIO 43140]
MKKALIVASALLAAQVSAKCTEPSGSINYLPMDITAEYCFDSDIEKWTYTPSLITSKGLTANSFFVTPRDSGVLSNIIVYLQDGTRHEVNILSLARAEVERVEVIKVID